MEIPRNIKEIDLATLLDIEINRDSIHAHNAIQSLCLHTHTGTISPLLTHLIKINPHAHALEIPAQQAQEMYVIPYTSNLFAWVTFLQIDPELISTKTLHNLLIELIRITVTGGVITYSIKNYQSYVRTKALKDIYNDPEYILSTTLATHHQVTVMHKNKQKIVHITKK